MKNFKKTLKHLWKDESGQGSIEYILVIIIVVAIAMIFGTNIKEAVTNKVTQLAGEISAFK